MTDVPEFVDANLRGGRFVRSDLSGVVMRGVVVDGMDVDAPWLGDGTLLVNGVDVVAFVEAELDRRFPGRSQRRAATPADLRAAWQALERSWATAVDRVAAMPAGTADVSVAGEWSFAQTLRHLVLATDMWLGRAVLAVPRPFHPFGLPDTSTTSLDEALFTTTAPPYPEVLAARATRVTMVRDYLTAVTEDTLAEPRENPHDPDCPETVLSCLQVILEEEWEHHRYALRDLTTLDT